MGTRSLTYFIDEDGSTLACIYRQYDGYLEGMGKDLATFAHKQLVNGFGGKDSECRKQANGMGCLVAQVIMKLKGANPSERGPIGNVYVYAPNTAWDAAGAEYVYYVRANGRDATGSKPVYPILEAFKVDWDEKKGESLRPLYRGDTASWKLFLKREKAKAARGRAAMHSEVNA